MRFINVSISLIGHLVSVWLRSIREGFKATASLDIPGTNHSIKEGQIREKVEEDKLGSHFL